MKKLLILLLLLLPLNCFAEEPVITASKDNGNLVVTFYKVDVKEDFEHITFDANLVASNNITYEEIESFLNGIIATLDTELKARADELALVVSGETEIVDINE